MIVLRTILLSLEAIISVLLIGIILIQKAKGGGLGLAFGGGGESLFGSRAGNVLTKGTVILAIAFMANTVALAILYARSYDRTLMDDHMGGPVPVQPTAQPVPVTPSPAPATQVPPAAATPDPVMEMPVQMDMDQPMELTIPMPQDMEAPASIIEIPAQLDVDQPMEVTIPVPQDIEVGVPAETAEPVIELERPEAE